MLAHPLSDTSVDRSSEAEPSVETISPELVLVDPELARRARALLPWPEPTLPTPSAKPVAVPHGGLLAADVALPSEVRLATRDAQIETLPTPERESPLGFRRRLAAVATLLPAVVALALIGEFVGRSGNPLGAAVPREHHPSSRAPQEMHAQPRAKHRSRRHGPAPPARAVKSGSGLLFHGYRIERLVAEIGRSPGAMTGVFGVPASWERNGEYCRATWNGQGLALMFVAGRRRNPCTSGRVVGGFATFRKWRTAEGLSVGSSLAELRRRYPHADAVGSGWWMLGTIPRHGARNGIPLHAHVTAARVDKLLVN